jgi:hypothetical protein
MFSSSRLARAKTENELTKLFHEKATKPSVEDVLRSAEVMATIRAEAPELLDFLSDPTNLEGVLRYALHAPVASGPPDLPLLSAVACRLLCFPSRMLHERLLRPRSPTPASQLLLQALREFPGSADGQTNPVLVGHFQEIFLAALRALPDLLTAEFPGFVSVVLMHTELAGYGEILVSFCGDHADEFSYPYKEINGWRYIAHRALACAEDYLRTGEIVFCKRVHGIFKAISQVLAERAEESFLAIAHDLEFIRLLVQATLAAPLAADMAVARAIGIDVLRQLCDLGSVWNVKPVAAPDGAKGKRRPGEAVRKFLKHFSIGFCEDHNVATSNWETRELTEEQRLLVDAFPVVWPGGVDYMFPLFFINPVLSPEFNRVFYERVSGFSRVRFLTFVHEHQILDRIIAYVKASPVTPKPRNGIPQPRPLNPQIWQLSTFIATGAYKKSKQLDEIKPYDTPDEYKEEYERFSSFVTDYLLPHITELNGVRMKNLAG